MKLDRGRCWVEGCVGLIAPFPLCPAFPVEAYAVVARLALTFTVVTSWPFFSTLDLAVLAGPREFSATVDGMYEPVGLPAAIATALLGLSTSWLLRSRHGGIRLEKRTEAVGCCRVSLELVSLGEGSGLKKCLRRKSHVPLAMWDNGMKMNLVRRRMLMRRTGAWGTGLGFVFRGHMVYKTNRRYIGFEWNGQRQQEPIVEEGVGHRYW